MSSWSFVLYTNAREHSTDSLQSTTNAHSVSNTQARRQPQRGPGKHYRGALSPSPHSVCREIETPRVRKRGEWCSQVGSRAGLKMDFMHILDQKEAIWNTIFSIFERRPPPSAHVAGPGKTTPSRRVCQHFYNIQGVKKVTSINASSLLYNH